MEPLKRLVVAMTCGARGTMNRQSTQDFQCSENTFHDITKKDTCRYIFVQTYIRCNTKSEP